jgi:ABC-type Fe3+/spermidine/putrescine transport system ATPase subunit
VVPRYDAGVLPGTRVSVFIRPEEIRASATPQPADDCQSLRAIVREVTYLGEAFKITATAEPLSIVLRMPRSDIDGVATGQEIWLRWPRDRSRVLISTKSG